MEVGIITDQHFGIRGDAPWMLDYQEKFYTNVFFPYLKEKNIKVLFNLGDLFDRRKYINFLTLNKTKKMFLDKLRDNEIEMYIIPGNHDIFFKTTNEFNSLKELLGEYKNIHLIEEPTTLSFDNVTFDFIPWINGENYTSTMKFIEESKSDICCGHLELANFEMYAGISNEHGMDHKLFKHYKQVWTGHFHHKSSRDNIHYLGSPMEFTWGDYDDPRGFHIFNTDSELLTFVQNPYTLYNKIFYNDSTTELRDKFRNMDCSVYQGRIVKVFVVRKTLPAVFEHFVENLYNAGTQSMVIMEDYSEFQEQNVDVTVVSQSTKELIETYVDNVDTDMDKSKIKDILVNVYTEATHDVSVL